MVELAAVLYLAFGSFIAYLMNGSFSISNKWVALPAIALFWPAAIFLPLVFVWAWISGGSH